MLALDLDVTEKYAAAMGTTAHVVVIGPHCDELLTKAFDRIAELEALWSRFLQASEIGELNNANGKPVKVSVDTISLLEHGIAAWRLTNGVFDPTMANQLHDSGYDRSFETIVSSECDAANDVIDHPGEGCGEIEIDRTTNTVTIPPGIGFDPGGFAKGLAADMVSTELIAAGATGALVNIGGDLAVKGSGPDGPAWVVTIRESTISDDSIATVQLTNAGLATSTVAKRRWTADGQERHHILDPSSGRAVDGGPILATVIAGEAWWAEVTATSLLIDEAAINTTEAALLLHADGRIDRLNEIERFEP